METAETSPVKARRYWGRTLVAFLVVLCAMPLGHALMILMEHFLPESALHGCAFAMGAVGLGIVIAGVFVKGDTRQTILGLVGGLLFWTAACFSGPAGWSSCSSTMPPVTEYSPR